MRDRVVVGLTYEVPSAIYSPLSRQPWSQGGSQLFCSDPLVFLSVFVCVLRPLKPRQSRFGLEALIDNTYCGVHGAVLEAPF